MSKLLYVMALVALVAVLACGGEDATQAPADTSAQQPTTAPEPTAEPRPTDTPTPTPTPEPMAIPVPTPSPEPTPTTPTTPTEASAVVSGTGAITPLRLEDPVAIAGELSGGELNCLAGVADITRLMQIFSAPETASQDELAQLFGCFEDETVLRMFVTTIVGLEEPLSEESSACVRAGMDGNDARAVMMAGSAGDAQAAMMGSMSAFFLILTCFNDEEFAEAAPALDVNPEDREGLLCLVDELGGSEKFAAALSGEDEDAFLAMMGAAMGCGLETGDGPVPVPVPTAAPLPTPESMTTPAPTAAPLRTPELMPTPARSTDQAMDSSPIAPLPLDNPMAMAPELSRAELACLTGVADFGKLMQVFSAPEMADQELQAQILGCLEDETVLRMFVTGMLGNAEPLSEESSMCIRGGTAALDLRSMMSAGQEADEAAMIGSKLAMYLTISCLTDKDFEAVGPAMNMTAEDRESLDCAMEQVGGLAFMAAVLGSGNEAGIMSFLGAANACGLPMEGGP